jgi:uncharacterized protein (TIGR02118 family)
MIRVSVSYPQATGQRFDHDYYQSQHRQLLIDKLTAHGLQRVEMDRCLADGAGGTPPVVAVAHMVFDTLAGFQQGMAANGKVIMADVAQYTDIRPQILVSETA